jgi:thiol-disulfide isomerase/thioredoxin
MLIIFRGELTASDYDSIKTKLMVARAELESEVGQKVMALAGLTSEAQVKDSELRIVDPNPGQNAVLRYAYDGSGVARWVDLYLRGELRPEQKTEASPSNRAPGLVLPLNSDSFETVAFDRDLDVVVLFYTSNYCKLCEELWPLYIKLAELLKQTLNLRFTSVNMALNELPEVHNIFYYPQLRYYPRDSKYRPYDYDQGLSLDDLLSFVKRVASVDLSLDHEDNQESPSPSS